MGQQTEQTKGADTIIIESAGSGSAGASTTLKQHTGQKSDQGHRQQDRGGEINSAPTHPTNTEENRQEKQPPPTEQPPTQDPSSLPGETQQRSQDPTGERANLGGQQGDLPSSADIVGQVFTDRVVHGFADTDGGSPTKPGSTDEGCCADEEQKSVVTSAAVT
eukprot:Gb_08765 [translate_table: standard]